MASTARIIVTIKKDILDPAGEALKKSLQRQGMRDIEEVRIGKVIDISLNDHQHLDEQLAMIKKAASSMLRNPIMEDVNVEVYGDNNGER